MTATWMAVSLSVAGKPVATGVAGSAAGSETASAAAVVRADPANNNAKTSLKAPAAQAAPLFPLAGQVGLPPYVLASPQVFADVDGLRGGSWRTAAADLIEHDFIFDLLFKLNEPDKGFRAGLGDDKGNPGAD